MSEKDTKAAVEEEKEREEVPYQSDVEALEMLQGFGEKMNVFLGMKEGKAEWKAYHIAPVPIKHIPELTKLIFLFQAAAEKAEKGEGGFTQKDCAAGAKMVLMGLEKTMPDVKEEEILENFSFGIMIKASQILIDLNDLGVQVDKDGNVRENPTMPIRRKVS